MSPIPGPKHQRIAGKVHSLFLNALESNEKCHCQVYQPIDLKISEHIVVNPDILIVCRPIMKQYLDFPPALVVEIISPSTEMKDRNTKYTLYENFGINYYVIIDPEKESVEIYRLGKDGKYVFIQDTQSQLSLEGECIVSPDWSAAF